MQTGYTVAMKRVFCTTGLTNVNFCDSWQLVKIDPQEVEVACQNNRYSRIFGICDGLFFL